MGYVLSAVVLYPFRFRKTCPPDFFPMDEHRYKYLERITSNLCTFVDLIVYARSRKDLQDGCQKMVADFDVSHLEPARKAHQKYIKLQQKYLKMQDEELNILEASLEPNKPKDQQKE